MGGPWRGGVIGALFLPPELMAVECQTRQGRQHSRSIIVALAAAGAPSADET